MDAQYFALLEKALTDGYVPHLPPLLDQTKPAEEQRRKNLSRAFGAFALRAVLLESSAPVPADCAKAVVDDFEDNGIDTAYYHAANETLYLVQGKLKLNETFGQDEAFKFCDGVRKLLREEFDTFNATLKVRQAELSGAIARWSHIVRVVAQIGAGLCVLANGPPCRKSGAQSECNAHAPKANAYFRTPRDLFRRH